MNLAVLSYHNIDIVQVKWVSGSQSEGKEENMKLFGSHVNITKKSLREIPLQLIAIV